MTAPTSARPAGTRSPLAAFPALLAFALRTCLPRSRRLALLLPCAAAVLFGLLARALDGTPDHNFAEIATGALFDLVLPVTALVVGDAVLGAEVRRGAFTFTWMSPVPVWVVVLARWMAGTIVASGAIALSFAVAAVVAGAPGSAAAAAVSGAAGATAYVAVFIAIGCLAQRAAVWSLAFIFLGERLLGAALSGVAQLSPSWEAQAAFVGLVDAQDAAWRSGIPHGGGALVRLVLITLVGLAVATIRLPHLRMAGASD